MLRIELQFSRTDFLIAVAPLAVVFSLVWSMPAVAQDSPGRFEAGGSFSSLRFNSVANFGPGLEGDFNMGRHFALDGAFNWLPAGSRNHTIQGLFGGKVGTRTEHFGVFVKVRPGFVSRANQLREFNEVPPLSVRFARLTERAIDFGGVLEYYPAKHWALRYDFGDTVVFQEGVKVIAVPPLISSSTGRTTNNFQFSTSFHYRF
jgi:outer membrane protein with beta-barrel domain